nr:MAG TPA: Putative oxidoreductase [Caudoviricetes sp.]
MFSSKAIDCKKYDGLYIKIEVVEDIMVVDLMETESGSSDSYQKSRLDVTTIKDAIKVASMLNIPFEING